MRLRLLPAAASATAIILPLREVGLQGIGVQGFTDSAMSALVQSISA